MLKKIFSKVNNFIQWTKKWHFFHVIFVGPLTLFVTYCIVVTTIFTIYPPVPDTNAVECDIGGTFWDGCVVYIVFLFVFLLFFASFIQLIVWIMSKIQKKTCCIKNSFLLHNKFYNIYYILSTLLVLICCSIMYIWTIFS